MIAAIRFRPFQSYFAESDFFVAHIDIGFEPTAEKNSKHHAQKLAVVTAFQFDIVAHNLLSRVVFWLCPDYILIIAYVKHKV